MFQIVINLITPRALFPPILLPQNQIRIGSVNRFRDMAIQNSTRRLTATILDLVQPEVAPFDPPTSKTLPRTKHEVDLITRCKDMAVRNFPKCEVGLSSVLNLCIVLMYSSSLRQERSARGVKKKYKAFMVFKPPPAILFYFCSTVSLFSSALVLTPSKQLQSRALYFIRMLKLASVTVKTIA